MKKIILIIGLIVCLGLALLMTGCDWSDYIYDMNQCVPPEQYSQAFANVIYSLNTPQKICNYMAANFDYEAHPYDVQSPYETWTSKEADCNDSSEFFVYACYVNRIGSKSGYAGCQIYLTRSDQKAHTLGLYWDGSYWDYSNVFNYKNVNKSTFAAIVQHYDDSIGASVVDYIVYNFGMQVVQDPEDYNNPKYPPY